MDCTTQQRPNASEKSESAHSGTTPSTPVRKALACHRIESTSLACSIAWKYSSRSAEPVTKRVWLPGLSGSSPEGRKERRGLLAAQAVAKHKAKAVSSPRWQREHKAVS